MPCPKCGGPDRDVHPVWTDEDYFEEGEHPKYIACENCRRLMDPHGIVQGQSETASQLRLTDHEVSRLEIGNQHTKTLSIIEWQAVKGAAAKYGVADWTAKADSSLTYEENIAKMQERGSGGQTIRLVAHYEAMRDRDND